MISLIAVIVLIVLDQIIKYWAVGALATGSITLIDKVLSFTYYENRGAAFGLMQNMQTFLIIASVIILIGIMVLVCLGRIKGNLLISSISLIVAGGIGNLIDRVTNGYVIDFIYFELIDFPIFNFADCCIVVGCGLMILYVMMDDLKPKKEKEQKS
ncbi:MAG: signal peptidase II [Oscillospiraceae bacterium]|nr:signal peptidase II [Oscillospiraceae bacterium]